MTNGRRGRRGNFSVDNDHKNGRVRRNVVISVRRRRMIGNQILDAKDSSKNGTVFLRFSLLGTVDDSYSVPSERPGAKRNCNGRRGRRGNFSVDNDRKNGRVRRNVIISCVNDE